MSTLPTASCALIMAPVLVLTILLSPIGMPLYFLLRVPLTRATPAA